MSGHNKWSQIKHRKGAADAMKSNVWGKLSKRISVESKKANGDVSAAHLRAVIEKAREANMPKENIDRAVAKGISADSGSLDTVVYETYGPGGVAILIVALTDSHNRTAQEIKHLLGDIDLTLASPGSAMWAFEKTGADYAPKMTVRLSDEDTEKLHKALGAIDDHDDVEDVYTNAE
jgi:YebC/PmpR family DNA-binding regulatory protein